MTYVRRFAAAARVPMVQTPAAMLALFVWGAIAGCLMAGTLASAAGTAATLGFNGPEVLWQPVENEVPFRKFAHECVAGGARDNAGCEHIALAAPAGQSVQLTCAAPRVAVLDELEARIWIKATQPGVQIAARIVLPRSVNARTKSAVTTIIRGPQYDRAGRWQQLVLSNVPRRLAEQVRVLRTEPGASIDPREAYVAAILLLVPGGQDAIELWTDDLDIDGVTLEGRGGVQPAAFTEATPVSQASTIRVQGGTLQVDGRAFLPRAITWNGEPLQFLADRGFNAVALPVLPTAEQANEARRAGVWFLCPPPKPDELASTGIGPACDRVLAWKLSDEIGAADPNYVRRWAELVRQKDPVAGRPIVVVQEADWENASQSADVVVAEHCLAPRMSEADFRQWLPGRWQLIEPDTLLWIGLPTQFDEGVGRQCAALSGRAGPPPNVDDWQLEMLTSVAVTERICGFVFASHSSLATDDAATRRRAASLELLNGRLQLLQPWLAGGKVVGRVQTSDAARAAAVLNVDYARLLMPIPVPADRAAAALSPAGPLSGKTFIVPGVPESTQVFHLSPVEMRSVPAQRVTGGMRAVWDADDDALLLLTEDPQAIASLRQHAAQNGAKVVRVERDLAAATAALVADTSRQLGSQSVAVDEVLRAAAAVGTQLRQVDALATAGRVPEAHSLAKSSRRALVNLAVAQRRAVGAPTELGSYPLGLSYDRLAEHAQFARQLNSLRGGENLLVGGDFEDIGNLTTVGWQHVSHAIAGVESVAELSANDPQYGSYCLELRATPTAAEKRPKTMAGAPIWITSPPLQVENGQLVEITGWVRIDEPIAESIDGLQIVDSLGGAELALTVLQTTGWQPFQIVRAATDSTDLRLTFALTGLGRARVDGVMVRPLRQPVARRLPVAEAGVK